jgi:dTDP-4-amino-4,6-dideoxygalactose transaminase
MPSLVTGLGACFALDVLLTSENRSYMSTVQMRVPYVVFSQQVAKIKTELMQACESVLESGMYVMGDKIKQFEVDFACYCETSYSASLSNGTTALYLVMYGMGIGPGDEVITAPNSFIASAGSIGMLGAKPVFVDVAEDLNMDPSKIEAAITPRTKAIMPVHLTGRPAKMDEINDIARKHGLKVIEDAAQAVGARYQGKRVGSLGDAACFSLHPLKNLHAFGDGGMMTTNDQAIYDHMIKSRNHGLKNRNECDFWSLNCRLDEIQAALLLVQLPLLDQWTEERRKRAMRYNELLRPYVETPDENEGEYCVWQTYIVKAERRDELLKFLQERGVQANVHYPLPLHVQEPAKVLGYREGDFPVTMSLSVRILSLPLYPEMTDEQQDYVVGLFEEFYRG